MSLFEISRVEITTSSATLMLCSALGMVACDQAPMMSGDAGIASDAASHPDDARVADADAAIVDADVGVLDAGPIPNETGSAGTVVEAPGAGSELFADPSLATNGVHGAGDDAGGTDVFSIGYGEYLILSWGGRRVRNGPGADFAVFENAFHFGVDSTFMDPTVVEVSIDAETWVPLPFDYVAVDEVVYSASGSDWVGFAGVTPVRLHAADNTVDPFDTDAAGGDHFDLDALGLDGEAGRIRRTGFVYLRLSPARDHDNPDTGEPFPRDRISNGPDIDGVIARYVDTP